METKQPTCEERIVANLEALEEDIASVLQGYYNGEDDGFENWDRYPLAVSTLKTTKIEFSWGGPSDFLKVEHDGALVLSVTYYFQDWFDSAERAIVKGSKVWEYAQTVIEAREECGY